jgi:cytochrome c oxidase cbb3-type subunit 2
MNHDIVEKNVGLMIILIIVALSFGTLVELVPLIFGKQEPIAGLKPLPALELEGRDIYIREGCNVCHSQMIRPLRAETERYGHYSVAGEFVYNHPRDVVPESNMPAFPWLFDNEIDGSLTGAKMAALRKVGVPYTDDDISGAQAAVAGKKEIDALIAYLQQLGTLLQSRR